MKKVLCATLLVISPIALATVEPEACFGDNKVFVTSVVTDKTGERFEETRYGTCDEGDPINIEYVEVKVIQKKEVPYVEWVEDQRPTPDNAGGDHNYPAVLTY